MPSDTHGKRVSKFIEEFLTLGGSDLGKPFKLLRWQKEFLNDLYLLDSEGRRLRRTYVLGVPRKNGKSQIGAAVALYQLIIDRGDDAPVIISAAGDRKQAKLVFDEAKRMVRDCPELADICSIYRDEIKCHLNGGVYKVVSADAGLAHGLNPSTVVFDELHVFKNSDLYVALTTGSAMRKQPLTLVISTAGHDLDGPLGKLYQYGCRVESGEVIDPTFGFMWHGPRQGEEYDPSDPAVWEKYNPSWEILNRSEFQSAYRQTPQSEFARYRLNAWTATENAWLPTGAWDACTDALKALEPQDKVILGFDGAWSRDSTALVAVRLDDLFVEVLGHWEAPPGDQHWRTPMADVEQSIRDACKTYHVEELVADPHLFGQMLQDLADDNLPVIEHPNTASRMIPATQVFYDSVMEQLLCHNGRPELARHVANAVLKTDAKGARITKANKSSGKHIDLAVAAVMALARARLFRDNAPREAQLLFI